jgi:dsRNA-specific ribonuclease
LSRTSGRENWADKTIRPVCKRSAKCYFVPPLDYRVVAEIGPDHEKRFVTEIAVGGKVMGRGEGRSKKQSEPEAAKQALEELQHSA